LGVIIPNMGTKSSALSDALFSKAQRRVLGLLFGHPERSFYANEIVRAARAGVGAVQRELEGLAAAGLVTVSRLGNQKHYQANRGSPIFEELRGIVAKVLVTARPAAAVLQQPRAEYAVSARPTRLRIPKKKIAALCRKYGVRKLSLFGSAARGEMNPESDVDLMVEFDPASKTSLWDYPAMQDDFSALFDHRKVDIASPEILRNPFRRKTILPDLKTLYEAR
jgi:predicted nucleotidyltransferase